MEQKRMTATEREAFQRIGLAEMLIRTEGENLKTRTKMIPRGAWRIASVISQLTRYINDVCDTIPEEQRKPLWRALQETSYTVGIRCPATRDRERDKQYGIFVPIWALDAIFAACGDHCITCMGGYDEQRKCPLRKALDAIPNDVKEREDGRCHYQGDLIKDATRPDA